MFTDMSVGSHNIQYRADHRLAIWKLAVGKRGGPLQYSPRLQFVDRILQALPRQLVAQFRALRFLNQPFQFGNVQLVSR